MKALLVVFGALLLTLVVQSRPCDEELPPPVPEKKLVEEQSDKQPSNVIDAPVVCPPGQKPDHNGKCRDVWSRLVPEFFEEESAVQVPKNIIDAPVVCPPGQKLDHKGKCRDVWGKALRELFEEEADVQPKNVIDAPVVCPPGQKPDHNGKCRDVWSRAVPQEEPSV